MENTHFYEFCHHGFQNRLKTSVFDQNRSILAQIKAKTMLFHVVQSASLSRFYRKHYLPSNLLENRKSWNPSVNSATVIFGAKMAVIDEILNVYKLADSHNPFSALPILCFLRPIAYRTRQTKPGNKQNRKKRPKSADLVVLRLSQREKIEKSNFLEEEAIFFKILSTAFFSTWMQTDFRPTSRNVDLVRRNFDFCVFLV